MSMFGAPSEGFTLFFGPPKKKGRRDEYEEDSGVSSEEDDPVEREIKKRRDKQNQNKKPAGRPKAAVERRIAEGGSSSWHFLFQATSSPYKKLVYGKNWSSASSSSLNGILSSNGLTINRAASLWLQSTNKPISSLPTGTQKNLMTALQASASDGAGDGEDEEDDEDASTGGGGEAEALLALLALSHAAEAMPDFAAGRAVAASDSVFNPTHAFETPYHWETGAEEREEMWTNRAQVATQQLAPSLRAASIAVRNALRSGDDGALRATLASIHFPNV